MSASPLTDHFDLKKKRVVVLDKEHDRPLYTEGGEYIAGRDVKPSKAPRTPSDRSKK